MRRFTYESWGIRPAINAHAFMAPIGGSIMPPDVDEDPALHEGPTAVTKGGGSWKGVSLREARDMLLSGDSPILAGYHHDGFSDDRDELAVCVQNLQNDEEWIVAARLREALTRKG
ncbi:MAG: hypothetical protein Q8O40_05095 [Chloroflexota bacterium]|nr:hypothetical protein [Chloroflexota bacterium]